MTTVRNSKWICWGLICLLFSGPAFSGDTDEETEFLDQAVRLKFSIMKKDISVTTATPWFSLRSRIKAEEMHRNVEVHTELRVELSGTVLEGKGNKPWFVQVEGIYDATENEHHSEELFKGQHIPKAAIKVNTEVVLEIDVSTLIRPGERQLIVSQGRREVWLTLELVSED